MVHGYDMVTEVSIFVGSKASMVYSGNWSPKGRRGKVSRSSRPEPEIFGPQLSALKYLPNESPNVLKHAQAGLST